MNNLVCQAQHLELNPLLCGQQMKLSKDWGDMFISSSIGYYPRQYSVTFECIEVGLVQYHTKWSFPHLDKK